MHAAQNVYLFVLLTGDKGARNDAVHMTNEREESNKKKELKTEVETQLPHVKKITGILFCRYSPLPMGWRSTSEGLTVGPGPLLVKYVAKPLDTL